MPPRQILRLSALPGKGEPEIGRIWDGDGAIKGNDLADQSPRPCVLFRAFCLLGHADRTGVDRQ